MGKSRQNRSKIGSGGPLQVALKKLGLFGGTFDPIHSGHLHLARTLQSRWNLDAVWFCPAAANPLKGRGPIVSADHRLAMVALAIEETPTFSLCDWEVRRPSPSYTVETLQQLHTLFGKETALFLLLGADAARSFDDWHAGKRILELATPLVGMREEADFLPPTLPLPIRKGWTPMPIEPYCSTTLRKKIANREPISKEIPKKVIDYITHFGLYST